jgi:hypothetical protein
LFYFEFIEAAKTFEERILRDGLISEGADFESVYHLVIDAVDNFNEKWEYAMKTQQQVKIYFQFYD